MRRPQPEFDGPIPGENFTADTKNYPWHRPPEIVDYDEGVEYAAEMFQQPHTLAGLRTLLESGMSVTTLTDIFITRSIGEGKFSIDLAILLAGPIARTIELYAKQLDVQYEMGYEDTVQIPSAKVLKGMAAIMDGNPIEDAPAPVEEPEEEVSGEGLMSPGVSGPPASSEEQAAMLGDAPEDEAI